MMVPESGRSNEPGETRTAIGAMGIKPICSGCRLEAAVDGAVGVGTSGWRLDPARGRSIVRCTLMRFASWLGWLSSSESEPRSAVGDGGPRSLGAGRLGWLAAVMSLCCCLENMPHEVELHVVAVVDESDCVES